MWNSLDVSEKLSCDYEDGCFKSFSICYSIWTDKQIHMLVFQLSSGFVMIDFCSQNIFIRIYEEIIVDFILLFKIIFMYFII